MIADEKLMRRWRDRNTTARNSRTGNRGWCAQGAILSYGEYQDLPGVSGCVHETLLNASIGSGADRKSTRLNSSHLVISYAVFCLKKKKDTKRPNRSPYHRQSLCAHDVFNH